MVEVLVKRRITKKCTGVAGRSESEINVAGGNPVILDVKCPLWARSGSGNISSERTLSKESGVGGKRTFNFTPCTAGTGQEQSLQSLG